METVYIEVIRVDSVYKRRCIAFDLSNGTSFCKISNVMKIANIEVSEGDNISVYENGTICIERSLNYEMESILTLPIYILFPSFYNLSTSITITLFVLDISFS